MGSCYPKKLRLLITTVSTLQVRDIHDADIRDFRYLRIEAHKEKSFENRWTESLYFC